MGTENGILSLLEAEAAETAAKLGLPLALEGRPFIMPAGACLECAIENVDSKAAALGSNAPLRIDGAIKLTACCPAGEGAEEAQSIAEEIAAMFPRGRGIGYEGALGEGELVFRTPELIAPKYDAGRVRVQVSCGFYAIIFKNAE